MLKAALHSKLFQLDSNWSRIEDILTGDFFGVLNYLPRQICLAHFVTALFYENRDSTQPSLSEADWEASEIRFWPRFDASGEVVEPDVVLITDKFIVVIEVKLDSGLGDSQPKREILAGRNLAIDYGLSFEAVYYLVIARSKPDVDLSLQATAELRHEMKGRLLHLYWWQVAAIAESWQQEQFAMQLEDGQSRMIDDLVAALRRRRSLMFSGFAFPHLQLVQHKRSRYFCPPAFAGFTILDENPVRLIHGQVFSRFNGFLVGACAPPGPSRTHSGVFLHSRFKGYESLARYIVQANESVFTAPSFEGFLRGSQMTRSQRTLELQR